ncbi:MAG: hypothetical protein GY791_10910 [Alphaproteobacteria bacterium]|nr:hypothetical protein [Alphaproteobacteria bacterium]
MILRPDDRPDDSVQTRELVALAGLVVVAALLRFYGIGDEPIRNDEIATINFSSKPPTRIWGVDTHPPLYYTLMHYWLALGDETVAIRSFSAIWGVLTVPLVYGLGRVLGDARVAAIAALLFAMSPFNIVFAQEARMYTLLTWAATLVMMCLAWLLRHQAATGPMNGPSGDDRTRWAWLGYGSGLLIALYSHNTAVFLLAAALLVGVPWLFSEWSNRRFRRQWIIAHGAIFAGWAVYWPRLIAQADRVYSHFWLAPPDLDSIQAAFARLHLWLEPSILMVVVLALAGVGIWAYRRHWRWLMFLGAFVLVAPVGELIVSFVRPIFYDRTLIWTTVPFIVLIALGIGALRPWPVRPVALVIVIGGYSLLLSRLYEEINSPRWDLAAATIAQHYRPGDVLAFNPNQWIYSLNYYSRDLISDPETYEIQPEFVGPDNVPEFEDAIEGVGRLWLIIDETGFHDPDGVLKPALAERYELAVQWVAGRIGVFLYCDPARWRELECPDEAPQHSRHSN